MGEPLVQAEMPATLGGNTLGAVVNGFGKNFRSRLRLPLAFFCEVGIDPSRETVFQVELALPVADDDEVRLHIFDQFLLVQSHFIK